MQRCGKHGYKTAKESERGRDREMHQYIYPICTFHRLTWTNAMCLPLVLMRIKSTVGESERGNPFALSKSWQLIRHFGIYSFNQKSLRCHSLMRR